MYVSMLDRPWLETPFVFQGFEVREQSEIDTLRRYCSTVYIDVDRGDLSDAQVKSLLRAQPAAKRSPGMARRTRQREPSRLLRWLRNLLMRMGMKSQAVAVARATGHTYPIDATVRSEAATARDAWVKLAQHHQQMMERATVRSDVHFGALRRAVQPAIDSVLRNPNALAWTVFSRKRSSENYNRAVGTAVWCLMFGRQLGFDRESLEDLAMGAMLLDIGNARLPKEIAQTSGQLSARQYDILRQHVTLGLEILDYSKGVKQEVIDMVKCHHERADGSGYPEGLQGNAIPVYGRIAAIADTYDAMTSDSPYSKPMAAYDAARALNEMRGKEFGTEVVEQFILTMGMFPVASIVELSDDTIAVVLEQNPNNVLRPKVMVLLDASHQPLAEGKVVEMRDLPVAVTHSNALWIKQGHEHGAFGVDPVNIFD